MVDLVKRVKVALARVGGRMTRQRRVILEVLQESSVHMTAKDLYLHAHARDPQVTLSTVYRTLDLCKGLGLISSRQLSPEHGPEWYEPVAGEDHYHIICLKCGQVVEFDAPEITRAVQRLTQDRGLTEAHASLSIYGICATCSQRAD
jgi:Fe2+ or Zn2+ uptake regulation protein